MGLAALDRIVNRFGLSRVYSTLQAGYAKSSALARAAEESNWSRVAASRAGPLDRGARRLHRATGSLRAYGGAEMLRKGFILLLLVLVAFALVGPLLVPGTTTEAHHPGPAWEVAMWLPFDTGVLLGPDECEWPTQGGC